MMTTVHRFPNRESAKSVVEIMNQLCLDTVFYIEFNKPSEADQKREVGSWAITTYARSIKGCAERTRAFDCCSMALQMALADALPEDHPMAQIWHLKKENRANTAKFRIRTEGESY